MLYAEEIQQCNSWSHNHTKRSMPEVCPAMAGLPEEVYKACSKKDQTF
jgi:hypothetical protein